MSEESLGQQRLKGWIHWKRLELAKGANEDEQMFLDSIIELQQKLSDAELRFRAARNLLLGCGHMSFCTGYKGSGLESCQCDGLDQEIEEELKRLKAEK